MTTEEQIKEWLTEAIQKVKAAQKTGSTHIWDVQARAEIRTDGIKYTISGYVSGGGDRLESDTLDGLIKLMSEYDPAEAVRASKRRSIVKLQSELAALQKEGQ